MEDLNFPLEYYIKQSRLFLAARFSFSQFNALMITKQKKKKISTIKKFRKLERKGKKRAKILK